MGKMLVAVLGLAVLGAGAWLALNRAAERAATPPADAPPTATSPAGASAPKRQLDNVRGAASRIESDADARAQDLDSKMREN